MDKQFDDLFRQQFEQAEVPAPDGVWESVSGQLASQATTGGAASAASSGLLMKGAAALLIATASYLAYRAYNTQQQIKVQAQPQTNQTQVAAALPSQIVEETEATNSETPEQQPKKAHREAIASQPIIECNGVDIADYEKSPNKTEEPSGKQGSIQEIAANIAEQPCAWTRSLKPRIIGESARSVVFMNCPDSFAAGTVLTWFCNGTEIGKGRSIRYTVLNHRAVQMNLKVQFPTGCAINQEFGPIEVDGCDIENNLLIPNVFTPNADGINDPYRVLICGAEQFQLSIFDRSGRRLFSSNDPEAGWDGKINGTAAPEGSYIANVRFRFFGHQEQEKTIMVWLKGRNQ